MEMGWTWRGEFSRKFGLFGISGHLLREGGGVDAAGKRHFEASKSSDQSRDTHLLTLI